MNVDEHAWYKERRPNCYPGSQFYQGILGIQQMIATDNERTERAMCYLFK